MTDYNYIVSLSDEIAETFSRVSMRETNTESAMSLRFPILQINSASGPFFFKDEHDGFPKIGVPVPVNTQTLAIKDENGRVCGQIIIPKGFKVDRH